MKRRAPPTRERALATWRAVLLVAALAAAVGGFLAARAYRDGDAVTGGLFTLALAGLLALLTWALRRVRALA